MKSGTVGDILACMRLCLTVLSQIDDGLVLLWGEQMEVLGYGLLSSQQPSEAPQEQQWQQHAPETRHLTLQ